MKKSYFASILASLMSAAAFAQDAPTIIKKPAPGTTVNLYRSTTGYIQQMYGSVPTSSKGDWQRVVFCDNGDVYLENPVNSFYTKAWLKGSRAEGDTIRFELPQAVYSEYNFFEGYDDYGYVSRLKKTADGNSFELNEASQTLDYVWRNDSLVMVGESDDIIGITLSNGKWNGYGEATYVGRHIDNSGVKPSDNAAVYDGLMLYMDTEEKSQLYPVKYAIDGDDVYLGDLSANLKGYWIKGEKNGNEVTFPATSFVGIDTVSVAYAYASSAVMGTGVDEMGGEYAKPCFSGTPLVFAYDPVENTLSSKGIMMVHKSADSDISTNIYDTYRYPLVSPWNKTVEAPLPPIFTAYQPFFYGYGGIEFKLSYYSQTGNYLEPSNLYYNFYIDGKKQTFSPAYYQYLDEDMTDVPYAYYDQYDFYKLDDNDRRLYFYDEPQEKIGIEALYIDGDTRLSSGITEYYINGETGLGSMSADGKRVEKVEYTDLSGRRVSRPGKGLYVRTVTYSDGSKASSKVVK